MQQTTTDAPSSTTAASQGVDHDLQATNGPAANAERHALKRTYLTLLPHTQLVELCLAFEAYSPDHIKNTLWPTSLAAAVAELQSVPPPSFQDTQKGVTSGPVANAPLDSASSPPDATDKSLLTGALATSAAIDPDLSSDHTNDHATTTRNDEPSGPQQPRTSDNTSQSTEQPQASTSFTMPAVTAPPQGPHAATPYGYSPMQPLPSYPRTPYYPPLGYPQTYPHQSSAPYPHAGFPPAHPHFPPAQGSGPSLPAVPLARHPHALGLSSTDHSGMTADDLPSYEDMLVEAITDLNEPDGSAPKSLFTWMASRYPLHTNFRPSASQALQKAFKRGRLEKGSNGKYRLNASWDGGSTSRRTTRRPQSFVQMAFPASHGAPATSPFTHAPLSQPARGTLAHNLSTSIPTSIQEKAPQYSHFPYQYPSGAGYPGYEVSASPTVSKGESSAEQPVTATSDATAQTAPGEGNAVNEEVGEGGDAWEAAQAILKAINFGSLLQVTATKPAAPPLSQPPPPANSVPAGPTTDRALASDTMNGTPSPAQVLSDRDRASLQAQLALLAAQLAEIAEDTLTNDLNVTDGDAGAEEGNGTVGEEEDMEIVDVPQQETEVQ